MINHNPLVSIIIPIYNVESYLKECLDSVLAQSHEKLEIICVNDGSVDSSGAIVQEYAKNDNRIIYIAQENKGQSAARNLGLQHASGEYVAFIDSDDYIDREFIKELVDHSTSDTLAYNFNVVFEYNTLSKRHNCHRSLIGKIPINQRLISSLDFYVCNALFSIHIIRTYNLRFAEGKICEDADFLFCYLAFCNFVYCLDSSAYHYRQRSNSTTYHLAKNHIVSLDRIWAFRHITLWCKEHNVLQRGLPFQVLYSLEISQTNVHHFMQEAKAVLRTLDIPQDMLHSDEVMSSFMRAKNAREFVAKKSLLSRRGLGRYFRFRVRFDEVVIVCFGYVLVCYHRHNTSKTSL